MSKKKKKGVNVVGKKKRKSNDITGTIELMIREFGNQVEALTKGYYQMPQTDLKQQVKKLEQDTIRTKEKLSFYHMSLAALIYKERFDRQIIIEGVQIDDKGNIICPGNDSLSRNV